MWKEKASVGDRPNDENWSGTLDSRVPLRETLGNYGGNQAPSRGGGRGRPTKVPTMQETTIEEKKEGLPPQSTHDRILDIALELFTERGYDKTSLRDIAERLGTTKAALYYHFKNKSAILLELHMRLHAIAEQLLDEIEALPDATLRREALPRVLDDLVTMIDENLDVVRLHVRNQSALSELDDSDEHQAANEDLQKRFLQILDSSDLSPEVRVRITCSMGAILAGLLSEGLVHDIPHDKKVAQIRSFVGAML